MIIAAFIAYLGRVVFGSKSVFSSVFFAIILITVMYYELTFLLTATIPIIEWQIPISLSAISILLASTGEKLLKLKQLKVRTPIKKEELTEQIL